MTITSNFKFSMAAIAASLLIAACGGGGGGDNSAAAPASGASVPAANQPTTGVAPRASVATPTYAADSVQLAAFNQLNVYRNAMGVGMLSQDPVLDTAAQAHALYLFSNLKAGTITAISHNEIPGNVNYYADTPLSRGQKAGAPATEYINEVVAANVSQVTSAATGADCMAQLLDTVYHLVNLTYGQETVGIGYMPGDSTWPLYTCVADFGTLTGVSGSPGPNNYSYSGGQQIASNVVVHSPLSNETGVRTAMSLESPNPAPDLSAPGRPIMVRVNAERGNTLSVAQFTLTDNSGVTVAARILVPSSAQASSTASTVADTNNMLPNGSAFLLPLTALKANTTYTVTFNGARDGIALPATSWTFTTGAN
jgi:Cysteine-rich secretory protein family